MDEISLRNRCYDVVRQGLEDEGVLTFDQTTAVGRAIMGVVDILLSSGALAIADTLPKGEDRATGLRARSKGSAVRSNRPKLIRDRA